MNDEWTHRYTAGRKTRDGYLVVTAGLHKIGEQVPYFSVTAQLWDSEGWYRNGNDARCRAAGRLDEEVSRAFPELRPVMALHLSTEDGVPMHALANSRYFTERGELDKAARTLRVTERELPQGVTEDEFAAFVAAQHERWADEAREAVARLDHLNRVEA